MANNCLKTTLKASVNNDSIEIMGTLFLKVSNGSIGFTAFTASWPIDVKTSNGEELLSLNSDGSNPTSAIHISDNQGKRIYLLPGNYYIYVTPKGNINYVGSSDGNTPRLLFNLDKIPLSVRQIKLQGSTIEGSLKRISGCNWLYAGDSFTIRNSTFIDRDTNDFNDLAEFPFSDFKQGLRKVSPQFVGSAESFVRIKVYEKEVTSGTFKAAQFWEPGLKITFDGSDVDFNVNGRIEFSWEPNESNPSNTDITCNGVTITIDSAGNKVSE